MKKIFILVMILVLSTTIFWIGAPTVHASKPIYDLIYFDGGGSGTGTNSPSDINTPISVYVGRSNKIIEEEFNEKNQQYRYEIVHEFYSTPGTINNVPVAKIFEDQYIGFPQIISYEYGSQVTDSYSHTKTFSWHLGATIKYETPELVNFLYGKFSAEITGGVESGSIKEWANAKTESLRVNRSFSVTGDSLTPYGYYMYYLFANKAYKQRVKTTITAEVRTRTNKKGGYEYSGFSYVGTEKTEFVNYVPVYSSGFYQNLWSINNYSEYYNWKSNNYLTLE
ncbi:hypothetical protein [Haploplasma axanthum]|uniref:Uncharacterized protein n=1 Tax=Haploplasma axanthum TaxID=29552 RepID=A0A449BBS1_HAPAX|nr:hypothetical protein [Haploplasma axanthum]VEU79886.1 Uncharacterised protein [Haploplasma axanthum]